MKDNHQVMWHGGEELLLIPMSKMTSTFNVKKHSSVVWETSELHTAAPGSLRNDVANVYFTFLYTLIYG